MKPKAEKASEQVSVKITPTELVALQSKLDGLRTSFGFNVSVSSYVRKLIQADLGELPPPVEAPTPVEPVIGPLEAPPVSRVAKAVAKLKDVSRVSQEPERIETRLVEPHPEPVEKVVAAETEATVRKLDAMTIEALAKTEAPEPPVKSEDFTPADLNDLFEGVG